jgi:hypothetical protein
MYVLYIHTYIHVHIRIYMYIYIHTYVYTYTHTYIYVHVCVCVCVCVCFLGVCVVGYPPRTTPHTHTHTHTHTYMYTHTHTHTQIMGVEEHMWVGVMQKGALKRRRSFASREDVTAYMQSRYVFKVFLFFFKQSVSIVCLSSSCCMFLGLWRRRRIYSYSMIL